MRERERERSRLPLPVILMFPVPRSSKDNFYSSKKMLKTATNLLRPNRYLGLMSQSTKQASLRDVHTKPERDFKWLWPAYREMEMFAAGHELGSLQTGGVFRYNTVKPLDPEKVEEAVRHLQRKIPNFCCFLKKRDGKTWVCEDLEPDIDFKYLEGADSSEIVKRFWNDPLFCDQSPPWKIRLIPVADDAPCTLPEVKAKYPHQYDFIILNHHSFIDGFTMAFVTGKLVEVLNDVLAGKPINDEPFGVYLNNDEIVRIGADIAESLQKDPEQLEAMKQEILACDSSPVILRAFPPPGGKPSTDHVHRHLSQSLLASFTARCKANGVTFNAGMEALINTAIMQMLKEKGVAPDSHAMSIHLPTDLRRYMKRPPLPVLGLHVRPIVHRIETPSDVRDHFWDYTKKLHQKVSFLLKSGDAIKQAVVREMTLKQPSPEEYFESNPKPVRDYCLTGIGDLTTIIPGVGDHLQQTNLTMYTAIPYSLFMMIHQIYTLRGISPYTISYDTSYMARDTVEKLMETVLGLMEELGSST